MTSRLDRRTRPTRPRRTGLSGAAGGGGGGAFSPDDIASLEVWWDASDSSTITHSSGAVSDWSDKSGNNHDLQQTSASLKPTTNASTQNGLNVIDFAGDYLNTTEAASAWAWLHDGVPDFYSMFAVWKPGTVANPNAAYGLYGTNAGSTNNIGTVVVWDDRASVPYNERAIVYITNGTGGQFVVSLDTGDGASTPNTWQTHHLDNMNPDSGIAANRGTLYIDGTSAATNAANSTKTTSSPTYAFQLGTMGNNVVPLTGAIAEVLFYKGSALTSGDVSNIETYLADKWGVTFS